MPEFTAAVFATKERPFGNEHSLVAHALLFEGSRPYWEVHINEKIFRFIPHTDFLLEDGLWQLISYCQIPESEYKHDVSNNTPITLEEEFEADICKQARENVAKELAGTSLHFKLVQWPGVWLGQWKEKIKNMQEVGVNITAHE